MTQLDLKQIGLWVLIWLIGYGLGLFEGWAKLKMLKEKPPEVIQSPPQLIEENYTLAIFEEGNALKLKMDGSKLESRAQMSEGQRKRLVSLVVGLRPWLEGGKTQSTPTPAPITAPVVQKPADAPAPKVSASNPPSQPLIVERSQEEIEYASLSMVQQINWLLQKNLEGHPLKAKRIRLQGALTGGVEFYVGSQCYEFIDEIADPEIQQVIKQAIAEWENKSTPSL